MSRKTCGDFTLDVWQGGYPVWVIVKQGDEELTKISHRELRDLHYLIEWAMREAKQDLPASYKEEV